MNVGRKCFFSFFLCLSLISFCRKLLNLFLRSSTTTLKIQIMNQGFAFLAVLLTFGEL